MSCSVQSLSRVFATQWTATHQASLWITNSQSLLKLMPIESVIPPNHLILCRPLLLLPSIFPSIWVFSNESSLCIRWPKYWNFSLSISLSNEYSECDFLRTDWFYLFAVQGLLRIFSSSHVWMWELDYKEGWALKNWCFRTVVLEKTLESPLDRKEIQSVNPKGNQSWILIGSTDAQVETPILWPPDAKNWLIGRDPDAGKDWGQKGDNRG